MVDQLSPAFANTGIDRKELPANRTVTGWDGVREIIDRRTGGGNPVFYSRPEHPHEAGTFDAFRFYELLLDASNGQYGGENPLKALNRNLRSGAEGIETCAAITNWIAEKRNQTNALVRHEEIFSYILDAHNGNVGEAIRDTMLYFQSLTRDENAMADVGKEGQLQARREKFVLLNIAPIAEDQPLPMSITTNPDDDLRNRVGEYYHQYWLMYLGLFVRPAAIRTLLAGEYLLFGLRHGKIKRERDFALVKQLGGMRQKLEAYGKPDKPAGDAILSKTKLDNKIGQELFPGKRTTASESAGK